MIVLLFKSRNLVFCRLYTDYYYLVIFFSSLFTVGGFRRFHCAIRSFSFSLLFLGSPQGLQFLDGFAHRLIRLAHANSTHKNMQSHFRVFTDFCHRLGSRPFPVQGSTILRYIAFLAVTGRSFGTVQNHISSLKHFHRLFGFPPGGTLRIPFSSCYVGVSAFWGRPQRANCPLLPFYFCVWFRCLTPLSQFRRLSELCFW